MDLYFAKDNLCYLNCPIFYKPNPFYMTCDPISCVYGLKSLIPPAKDTSITTYKFQIYSNFTECIPSVDTASVTSGRTTLNSTFTIPSFNTYLISIDFSNNSTFLSQKATIAFRISGSLFYLPINCFTDLGCNSINASVCDHIYGCQGCSNNDHCSKFSNTPFCYKEERKCVNCLSTDDCTSLGPSYSCKANKCVIIQSLAIRGLNFYIATILVIGLLSAVVTIIVRGEFKLLFDQIHLGQMICLLKFYNLNYTVEMNDFLDIFFLWMLRFLPNPLKYILSSNYDDIQSLSKNYPKFEENEITGILLKDYTNIYSLYLVAILFTVISKAFCNSKSLELLGSKIREKLGMPMAFKLFNSTVLIHLIPIIMGITIPNFNNVFMIVSWAISVAIGGVFVGVYILIYIAYKKISVASKAEIDKVRDKYSLIYSGYQTTGARSNYSFLGIVYLRDFLSVFFVIFFYNFSFGQIISQVVLMGVYSFTLHWIKPFSDPVEQTLYLGLNAVLTIAQTFIAMTKLEVARTNNYISGFTWCAMGLLTLMWTCFTIYSVYIAYRSVKERFFKSKSLESLIKVSNVIIENSKNLVTLKPKVKIISDPESLKFKGLHIKKPEKAKIAAAYKKEGTVPSEIAKTDNKSEALEITQNPSTMETKKSSAISLRKLNIDPDGLFSDKKNLLKLSSYTPGTPSNIFKSPDGQSTVTIIDRANTEIPIIRKKTVFQDLTKEKLDEDARSQAMTTKSYQRRPSMIETEEIMAEEIRKNKFALTPTSPSGIKDFLNNKLIIAPKQKNFAEARKLSLASTSRKLSLMIDQDTRSKTLSKKFSLTMDSPTKGFALSELSLLYLKPNTNKKPVIKNEILEVSSESGSEDSNDTQVNKTIESQTEINDTINETLVNETVEHQTEEKLLSENTSYDYIKTKAINLEDDSDEDKEDFQFEKKVVKKK